MKIGLIAVSGLRVCDTELLMLGLTFPTLVRRKEIIENLPSLGLLTIAALTPPHIELEYRELAELPENVAAFGYDAVAISCLSATAHEARAISARFRAAGVPTVLGGLHATLCPDDVQPDFDAIAVGEGEVVWPEIVRDLEAGALKPRYTAGERSFNLRDAPMPRFDLLPEHRYPRFTVQTQRGCPFRCEFCAASMRLTSEYKIKPVEKVIAEVRRIKSLWGHPFIEFADDNTFVNRAHGRELMRALAKEHVRWFTESDVSVAEDEDLLKLMRDAGCMQILIGFESPVPSGLEGLEMRSNWKARQLGRYAKAIERIQRQGITVNGCFVIGLDGTGREAFDDVANFVESSGLFDVQITVQTPFPGTPLYDRLLKAGRILKPGAWERCTLFDINFQPEAMSPGELRAGLVELTGRLYHPDTVRVREEKMRTCCARQRDWPLTPCLEFPQTHALRA